MNNEDRLSAFINEARKMQGDKVHRKVFEPRDGASSVFVTSTLMEAAIWSHADDHYSVGENAKRAVGRGDLTVNQVLEVAVEYSADLSVVDDVPPPLHANIVGFPSEVEHERAVAQALARKCGQPIRRP